MIGPVPDYVAPLEGWRIWHIVERDGALHLVSPLYRTAWPARQAFAAACRRGLEQGVSLYPPRTRHSAPTWGCGCGIYGSFGPAHAVAYMSRFFKHREDVIHRVIGNGLVVGRGRPVRQRLARRSRLPAAHLRSTAGGTAILLPGVTPSGPAGRGDRARTHGLRRARPPRRVRVDRRIGRDRLSAGPRHGGGLAASVDDEHVAVGSPLHLLAHAVAELALDQARLPRTHDD